MKHVSMTLIAATIVLTCGLSYGQEEPGPNFEHLKSYGPMLGTWRYEGPLLEDLPGIAEKGPKILFQFSWRRILNKNVVEENVLVELDGKTIIAGKALIGWNAEKKEIAYGGMNSLGNLHLGTVAFDKATKTSTLTTKGIDKDGEEISFKAVVTKTGRDTLTWQALQRAGGIVEGPSPVYAFKRVKRVKRTKSSK